MCGCRPLKRRKGLGFCHSGAMRREAWFSSCSWQPSQNHETDQPQDESEGWKKHGSTTKWLNSNSTNPESCLTSWFCYAKQYFGQYFPYITSQWELIFLAFKTTSTNIVCGLDSIYQGSCQLVFFKLYHSGILQYSHSTFISLLYHLCW